MSVIAIDLGGTKALGAVFTTDGDILVKKTCFLGASAGEDAGNIVFDLVRSLMSESPDGKVDAVGICVPGIVYSEDGSVWAPNIKGWDRYPLRSRIEAVVGKDVRVAVESDRTCYILGEAWKGAARGISDAVYMAVGTGIGMGILLDGRVVRGYSDIAGAAGWMILDASDAERNGLCANFESVASGSGLGIQIRKAVKEDKEYAGVLSAKPVEELSSYDVFAHYDTDPLAAAVLDRAVQMWGMASANVISLLNPKMVVFGGGIFGPASRFLDRIREEALKWGQPYAVRDASFVVSELPGEAALYGAARLVINA